MMLGVERSSHGSTALTCPLGRPLHPKAAALFTAQNLARARTHCPPLIKFNDSAKQQVASRPRGDDARINRQRDGWRRGSFFFFFLSERHKKVREKLKKSPRHPLNGPCHRSVKDRFLLVK